MKVWRVCEPITAALPVSESSRWLAGHPASRLYPVKVTYVPSEGRKKETHASMLNVKKKIWIKQDIIFKESSTSLEILLIIVIVAKNKV